MPWPGSRFSSSSALGRLIVGVRDGTLQRVKRPFPERGSWATACSQSFQPAVQSSVREAVIDFRETSDAPYLIKEIRRGCGRNPVRPRGVIGDRLVAPPGCG
jgi:hypothetical protein